ncbi:hypothetical protein [Streptomyces sp. NBC_01235]|uniref:hypothetical protein n=1 Tax=Streptomyces sp. NBC_01235 TaxID=2903788 RepID=UPI002E158D2F|nr:hypothetical protein OG289_00965 [Streptomyces sp. NBC_01235]
MSFTKSGVNGFVPSNAYAWYATTSRCNDFNVRLWSGYGTQEINWCWRTAEASWDCQERWTKVGQSWTAVATNVKDGTHSKIQFRDNKARVKGSLAF